MAASTLIFVLVGVGFVSGNVMQLLMWLDQPQPRRKARYAR